MTKRQIALWLTWVSVEVAFVGFLVAVQSGAWPYALLAACLIEAGLWTLFAIRRHVRA